MLESAVGPDFFHISSDSLKLNHFNVKIYINIIFDNYLFIQSTVNYLQNISKILFQNQINLLHKKNSCYLM